MERKTAVARATIDDVAKEANVSIKTVSRVINKEPNVRERTRERVLEAVKKLGYHPSQSARVLAGNRTFLIALVYDNPSPSYLVGLQNGALAECNTQGYTLVLHPVDSTSRKLGTDLRAWLETSPVDGLILTPPINDSRSVLRNLKEIGIPFVSIAPQKISEGLRVSIDDRAAAKEMTNHLISLGHEKIGFIKGHPSHGAGRMRFDGFKDAMGANDITINDHFIAQGYFSFESGRDAAETLLDGSSHPTAIFAANDDMAAAVIQVAAEKGIVVPKDLSVVGFDDSVISRQVSPPLTTIRQPIRQMGETATRLLLQHLRTRETPEPEKLDYQLMERGSCGTPS